MTQQYQFKTLAQQTTTTAAQANSSSVLVVQPDGSLAAITLPALVSNLQLTATSSNTGKIDLGTLP